MTDELIRRLIAAGLNKQQATSVTAETLVKLFMQQDGKILIEEARLQVSEMQRIVNQLKIEYGELKKKIESVSDTLLAISEAQKEHGEVTEKKPKT